MTSTPGSDLASNVDGSGSFSGSSSGSGDSTEFKGCTYTFGNEDIYDTCCRKTYDCDDYPDMAPRVYGDGTNNDQNGSENDTSVQRSLLINAYTDSFNAHYVQTVSREDTWSSKHIVSEGCVTTPKYIDVDLILLIAGCVLFVLGMAVCCCCCPPKKHAVAQEETVKPFVIFTPPINTVQRADTVWEK